jgi:hypothetical protein
MMTGSRLDLLWKFNFWFAFFKDESNKEIANLEEKSTSNVSASFVLFFYQSVSSINKVDNAQLTTLSTLMLLFLGR